MIQDEPLQGQPVNALNHFRAYPVRLPVLHAHHGNLAHGTTSRLEPLGPVLVPLLAAHVGFVYFNRSPEGNPVILKGLPDSHRQVPCRLLGHVQVPVELHRKDALQARGHEVDGDCPRLATQGRVVHEGVRLDREVLPARPAAVGLRLPSGPLLDVVRVALRAVYAVRPPHFGEPPLRRLIIGEHAEQCLDRESLSECLAGCLVCHLSYLRIMGIVYPKTGMMSSSFCLKKVDFLYKISYGLVPTEEGHDTEDRRIRDLRQAGPIMAAPTNAAAIANTFLDIQAADNSKFPEIDPMKLQKLLYYSQAWWLGGMDSDLFSDDIEAWPWGPVVRDIYVQFTEFGREPIIGKRAVGLVGSGGDFSSYVLREPDDVPENIRIYLDSVWSTHKEFTGVQLSNATHAQSEPWAIVKRRYGSLEDKPKIPSELIRDVFRAKQAA